MRKMLNIRSVLMVIVAMVFLSTLVSCEKNDPETPELPPLESIMMDFSDFEESIEKSASTYNNWSYSVLTVGFWNVYATAASAVPVAAYVHALDQDPVYLGDNQWEWSFSFMAGGVEYEAVLTAERINNEEFTVEMALNLAAMPNQIVKWFDGVVRYDHTQASWTFYKDGSIEMLGIVWNKDFETGAADLTYTYLEAGSAEEGSYIMWSYTPDEVYDAAYNISLSASTVDIEWNKESLEGRVKSPVHFGDELWHCWDSQAMGLVDKVCE